MNNQPDSALLQILHQTRLSADDSVSKATHFSLGMGKYAIPPERRQEFLIALAHALHTQQPRLFLIEKKTPVFRMHMDIDFIQKTQVSTEDIKIFTAMLSTIMRDFYPAVSDEDAEKMFSVVIMAAAPKRCKVPDWPGPPDEEPEEVQCVKTGFHLIWPFLYVDKPRALSLRYACLKDVEQRMPARPWPCNPYSDVIDECVLKENGLRMIGNDKCRTCACVMANNGRRFNNTCDLCERTGMLAENRKYWPIVVVTADGRVDETRTGRMVGTAIVDYRYKVKFCSTQLPPLYQPTPGYEPPALAPACPGAAQIRSQKKKRRTTEKTSTDTVFASESATSIKFRGSVDIDCKTEVFFQIQQFLRTHMGAAYAEVKLHRLRHLPHHRQYICSVDGVGSSFCHNVQRDHSSSTIYFQVEEDRGVFQRCFCKKNNATTNSLACRAYCGPSVSLTPALQGALFTLAETAEERRRACGVRDVGATPAARKLARIDSTLDYIGEHIEQRQEENAGVAAVALAVSARRKQEVRLTNLTGRETPILKAPGMDLTWYELDQLSFAELRKLDEKRANDVKNAAKRMHDEVFDDKTKKKRGSVAAASTKRGTNKYKNKKQKRATTTTVVF